jgi:hypothetical protein
MPKITKSYKKEIFTFFSPKTRCHTMKAIFSAFYLNNEKMMILMKIFRRTFFQAKNGLVGLEKRCSVRAKIIQF